MNNSLTGFLGTYASPESLGIYRFTIDLRNGASLTLNYIMKPLIASIFP